MNSDNQRISPDQVRALLVNNEKLLADYNEGRKKKTGGNVLLIGGLALLASDLVIGVTTDGNTTITSNSIKSERNYPSVLTYLGLGAVVLSIPLKIGFSEKIRNVVADYNNQKATGNLDFNKQNLDFITNSNGVGFRLTLN